MPYVSVFMDVEDPINPCADDAAREIATIFSGLEIRGSFCVTGEKCRTLVDRGRGDVLDAYQPHCLGLHTDTHSIHPTTMEMLADVPYDEGCRLAMATESRGFEAFHSAFQRKPVFWGGAGNTWSPEISYAIDKLGIPAYSYALTSLPNFAIHRFNGVMALPQALSISEADWADDERARMRTEQVVSSVHILQSPWLGIFVGHPSRFRYSQFWDVPYNAGRTTANPEEASLTDEAVYQRSIDNLCEFLEKLKALAPIVGVDDLLQMNWQFRPPSEGEVEHFRTETSKAIRSAARWPIHRQNLNPEGIVAKTMALQGTVEVAYLE